MAFRDFLSDGEGPVLEGPFFVLIDHVQGQISGALLRSFDTRKSVLMFDLLRTVRVAGPAQIPLHLELVSD